jgi:hypothetical protein
MAHADANRLMPPNSHWWWRVLAAIVGTSVALDVAWHLLRDAAPLVFMLAILIGAIALWRFWRDRGW